MDITSQNVSLFCIKASARCKETAFGWFASSVPKNFFSPLKTLGPLLDFRASKCQFFFFFFGLLPHPEQTPGSVPENVQRSVMPKAKRPLHCNSRFLWQNTCTGWTLCSQGAGGWGHNPSLKINGFLRNTCLSVPGGNLGLQLRGFAVCRFFTHRNWSEEPDFETVGSFLRFHSYQETLITSQVEESAWPRKMKLQRRKRKPSHWCVHNLPGWTWGTDLGFGRQGTWLLV